MNVNAHLVTNIHPSAFIDCPDVQIGVGVFIEKGVRIVSKRVRIGDFVYIGRNATIRAPEFAIGDYTRLNEMSFAGGAKPLSIGRNCYFGRSVYLDSNGGLTIDDNVGVGASSQLWTHIKYGDIVQGCRWDKEYPLHIEHDAWLVAKVTVGGCQHIGARVQVFNESNVTKRELPADTTWAGNPACDVTDRFGPQFEAISDDEKRLRLQRELARFYAAHPEYDGALDGTFNAVTRTYHKSRTAAEVSFLRFTLAKFVPEGED